MTTRRDIITNGLGLAAIIAAGKAPAALVRSMAAARQTAFGGGEAPPYDYEVEYVYDNGLGHTVYIGNFDLSQDFTIDCEFKVDSFNWCHIYFIGAEPSSLTTGRASLLICSSTNTFTMYFNNANTTGCISNIILSGFNKNIFHKHRNTFNSASIDDVSFKYSNHSSYCPPSPLEIFKSKTIVNYIKSLSISNNNGKIIDLIGVVKNGVVGFWDKIGMRFYTSQLGELYAGPAKQL